MATSRTGTAKWKAIRERKIRQAKATGETRCPICGIELAFDTVRQPDSPELGHILSVAMGGEDTSDNTRLECYEDNRRKGPKLKATATGQANPFPTLVDW